ncbi:MAG TPA: PLD nuclease N-terminal domain-containing protein [Ktedonobacterales bacterium]|nr:PLD nuclease N-terminal domain-containing protein [Ktedonobacterales bacterium]
MRDERVGMLRVEKPYPNAASTSEEDYLVASNRQDEGIGCLAAGLLAAVIIFIPVLGHIILTIMILGDDLSDGEKLLWLVVVWIFWFVGPFLYLLLGQRRNRLFSQIA